jgi:hypothetical protein
VLPLGGLGAGPSRIYYALGQKKRVVPVLVDDTELAPELSPLHGIDLRGALHHPDPVVSEDFSEWQSSSSSPDI